MEHVSEAIRDCYGRVMFYCAACARAMTRDDFFEQALRLPDHGESSDEYLDAEVITSMIHVDCVRAARAI